MLFIQDVIIAFLELAECKLQVLFRTIKNYWLSFAIVKCERIPQNWTKIKGYQRSQYYKQHFSKTTIEQLFIVFETWRTSGGFCQICPNIYLCQLFGNQSIACLIHFLHHWLIHQPRNYGQMIPLCVPLCLPE